MLFCITLNTYMHASIHTYACAHTYTQVIVCGFSGNISRRPYFGIRNGKKSVVQNKHKLHNLICHKQHSG